MYISVRGVNREFKPEPKAVFPEYAEFETDDGHTVHLDNDGNVITYRSYLGYDIDLMNQFCRSVTDLGDRIEIEKYVGGIYYWYRYHICKGTRKPIAYFDSTEDLQEGQVDIGQFRLWTSIDLGDHVVIEGMYGNKTQIFRKSDNSVVVFTKPDGSTVSKFNHVKVKSGQIWVKLGWWKKYKANLETQTLC